MSVYFIEEEGTGLIKIGHSNDTMARLASLQTGNPRKLTLLREIEGKGEDLERELHERYKANRLNGEWFNISRNDVDCICCAYNHGKAPKTIFGLLISCFVIWLSVSFCIAIVCVCYRISARSYTTCSWIWFFSMGIYFVTKIKGRFASHR
jgi:hypothetical protein